MALNHMTLNELKENDQTYIMSSYGRVDVALVKGKNARAWDETGKMYIDFTSGIGVNALGYADEKWAAAVGKQAAEIQHMSNYYYSPMNIRYAQKLSMLSGMKKSFFCNSGAEANECAIKLARKHGEPNGAYKIVTLANSFHGRTLTTLAATGQDSFHQHFLPLTDGFAYAEANQIESVRSLLDDKVCAVMVEMVQGEGGVIPMEPQFIKELKALCDESGVLLIVDEVQTGIGRTGYFFAYQGYGINPDIVTCAKGLAGGLPIGVCMVNEKLENTFSPGMNGSTFGGNPVACAGGLEVLDRVGKEEFLTEVTDKGRYMVEKLQAMKQVAFVRGKGLMLGIKLKDADAHDVLIACAKAGLLVLTAKDLVRFLPPLTITKEDIDDGLSIFERIINQMS